MKKTVRLFFFFLLATSALQAQKVYYIYLQTDNQQPFYARLGEKIFNSGAAGYLILPNLRDSTYTVRIGISGNQQPDQPFSITVNKKDQGFIFKNFGEKGWGLFNINSMTVIMPEAVQALAAVQTVKTEKRESSPFTDLLAKAADDSTIKERPVIVKTEEKKPEAIVLQPEKKEEIKTDTITTLSHAKNPEPKKEVISETVPKKEISLITEPVKKNNDSEVEQKLTEIKTDTIVAVPKSADKLNEDSVRKEKLPLQQATESETGEFKRSEVILRSESSTTAGIGLVFLDMLSPGKTDTIRILIPPPSTKQQAAEIKGEKKFLDITTSDSATGEIPGVITLAKAKCTETATEEDFLSLRRKMVGENNDDAMIAEAGKVFKTKCFTTTQIKNLSALFLNDESKYKFFDTAYGYVIDPANFPSLESELKDNYFINRFKAMLRL